MLEMGVSAARLLFNWQRCGMMLQSGALRRRVTRRLGTYMGRCVDICVDVAIDMACMFLRLTLSTIIIIISIIIIAIRSHFTGEFDSCVDLAIISTV